MRVPRFFIRSNDIDPATGVANLRDSKQIWQIMQVLRLRSSDLIDLLDGEGNIYRCRLNDFTKKSSSDLLTATIEKTGEAKGEPSIDITVALPILRRNRFEWAVEKLTELGVRKIVALIVERSVALGDNSDRWHAIAKEAAEQCERALIPNVVAPTTLVDFLGGGFKDINEAAIILAERSNAMTLPAVLCNLAPRPNKISIIVGAEGGFTANELQLAQDAGAHAVFLGARILRAETAAIYAVSITVSTLDPASDR